jgi:hypothetical protein
MSSARSRGAGRHRSDGWRNSSAASSIGVLKEVNPMKTLRASAIALPFVALALVVAGLSLITR